eukprot:scaffold23817_cov69-Phaeocystis_antarctica.AAC.7
MSPGACRSRLLGLALGPHTGARAHTYMRAPARETAEHLGVGRGATCGPQDPGTGARTHDLIYTR